MSDSLLLHVRNAMDAIGPANDAAEAWLTEKEAPADVSFLVSLALEEVVTNCIKYGYDDEVEHTIDVSLSYSNGALTMVIADDGHEFNPLDAPPPDLSLAIEDRPIGGLGIHLLRELSDDVTYERRDGINRLTLTKRSAGAGAE